jgi:hypothetical protein
MCLGSMHIMYVPEIKGSCLMLMYSPLSAYFDDVIPQQPALSNDGKQRQPALGDFTSPIGRFDVDESSSLFQLVSNLHQTTMLRRHHNRACQVVLIIIDTLMHLLCLGENQVLLSVFKNNI